ncbi:MAG: hypothetical protein HYV26_05470 [Candidatus Hydrogenedentes bacterium]|nr:hypothetical protein [Candidatus Hydrogenedentota bacterium]
MNVLQMAEEQVRQHPSLRYERHPHALRVEPPNPNGFPVSLEVTKEGFSVRLGGWQELFEEERDALECFQFAFSPHCRLRVGSRGGVDCEWALEFRDGGVWHEDSSTDKKSFQVWKSKEIRYLHNIIHD